MRLRAVRIEANSRASDENWELSIDQIPQFPVLHGCIASVRCFDLCFALSRSRFVATFLQPARPPHAI
jgi:hypothetical protein